MTKTLLIVGAGLESIPGIILAKKLGLKVVVSDSDLNAPGIAKSDYFIEASTYDAEKTLFEANNFSKKISRIDGVICIASDVPLTVSKTAKSLNLPCIDLESAKLATNKLAMKNCFKKNCVNTPWFSEVKSLDELKDIVLSTTEPLVIKPNDSRGSRGVLRLVDGIDLSWSYNYAKDYSPTKKVIVEKFLVGPQISTESLIINGIAYTPGFSDRNYEFFEKYSPHIIENGGQLPPKIDINQKNKIENLIQLAANSLGIKNGVLKGDIVLYKNEPYIIEAALRLSGGYFCSHEIPLNSGVDLVGAAIRQSLGEEIDPNELKPKFNNPVAQRYLFLKPGKIKAIDIPKWINKDPDICFFENRIKVGDIIEPIENHPKRSGVVITTGKNLEMAIAKARNVISSIKISFV